ncbi:hypothetical protein J3B02_003893 [Coemansia erecta]|uniref:Myb-like domain-containing protein n=1 Tax=Coemansia asiatica TaxID=1052880 RepID=A0A9W7XQ23_9FUNG|nr:hypothetical protein LPJ64_000599 [Coemansia asiatica]KAJ2848772.1 hypothetical protein J3B02_003893 [Coemansia erecta]KAJ2881959.1 hypothetical protein FB639_002501 [Coemansia asiatica]
MSGKKQAVEIRPQSQFFAAPSTQQARCLSPVSSATVKRSDGSSVGVRDVLRSKLKERMRACEEAKARGDDEWDESQFVQLDRETSDHVKSLIEQSDAIKRVRKERIFEDEVTEEEQSIIQQRVALQQKQFAEFERREFAHKARRIRQMYSYLDDEEIREALKEGKNDVDETIYQFSTPGYLLKLRKAIALRYTPLTETPQMTDVQRVKYEEMLKKRIRVQKKTTTSDARDKYRTVGRLPLDEALAQLQRAAAAKNGSGIDLSKAMKGWSEARIKAFKAIKTKPNTYYYRFNAPGEEQRTGQWTTEEQKLFHARLKEIGANGQWGIFSMTIPGRVGYQCSNYYRYLVENRLIHDPNYVLDEKGKAHFLFTTKKKNPDGTAMRVFRKHKKPHVRMSREKYGYSDSDDDDDDEAEQSTASSARDSRRAVADSQQPPVTAIDFADPETPAVSSEAAPATGSASSGNVAAAATTRKSTRAAAGLRKRKRRGRFGDYSSDEDVIRANEVELSDDGAANSDTSDGEFCGPAVLKRQRSGRRRNNNGGGSSSNFNTDSGNSSAIEAPARGRGRVAGGSPGDAAMEAGAGGDNADGSDESELCSGVSDNEIDPNNPLPDLLDPITLEPVSKPAISPYGHVMGYDSWVRCLMFPPEGSQRNICPLTKKPLSKRDLVVLTFDNIELYRDKIVNL